MKTLPAGEAQEMTFHLIQQIFSRHQLFLGTLAVGWGGRREQNILFEMCVCLCVCEWERELIQGLNNLKYKKIALLSDHGED